MFVCLVCMGKRGSRESTSRVQGAVPLSKAGVWSAGEGGAGGAGSAEERRE